MIAVAALLVVIALVLLVAGLSTGHSWLLWTAAGVSGLVALALLGQELVRRRTRGGGAGERTPRVAAGSAEDPPAERVEAGDLLLVLDRSDEVVVVDEQPRYHLAGCSQTAGRDELPLSRAEARQNGFTACGICRPDRHIAERVREDAGD